MGEKRFISGSLIFIFCLFVCFAVFAGPCDLFSFIQLQIFDDLYSQVDLYFRFVWSVVILSRKRKDNNFQVHSNFFFTYGCII